MLCIENSMYLFQSKCKNIYSLFNNAQKKKEKQKSNCKWNLKIYQRYAKMFKASLNIAVVVFP